MTKDSFTFRNDTIAATVTAEGAELCSLKNAQGLELLWQAGEAWPRHAPLLFPIVGRMKNDELRHGGKTYPMTQHGFARDYRFDWVRREPSSCKLVLADDASTRARYPFAFRLSVTYTLDGADLDVAPRDRQSERGDAAGIGRRPSGLQLAAAPRPGQGGLCADVFPGRSPRRCGG